MLRSLFTLSVCLGFCAAFAAADEKDKKEDKTKPAKITVSPSGVWLNRKLDPKLFPNSNGQTNVSLLVHAPGRIFLGLDKATKLDSFKDDKGNSLVSDKSYQTSFSLYPSYAENRSAIIVGLNSYGVAPGKGASKLLVKGELTAVFGTDEKSTAETKVEFKDKQEVKFGDLTLKVQQAKGFWGGPRFEVVGPHPVKAISIKDSLGNGVEASGGLPYRAGFGDKQEWRSSFDMRKELAEGKVTVIYFTKEEKVKVPVDVEVGLDLH